MSDYATLIRPTDLPNTESHLQFGAPATGRSAAGRMPYFDTPQKWGQISVVVSIPESLGEAML